MPKVVSWRKLRFRFDWTLTVSATICFCLGLLNLWSAVRERQFNLFAQQLIALVRRMAIEHPVFRTWFLR